jgi:hypothetical protein
MLIIPALGRLRKEDQKFEFSLAYVGDPVSKTNEIYVLMYENGKMRPVETIPGMGRGGIKENYGGVNSTVIYC